MNMFDEYKKIVYGFIDTYEILPEILSKRKQDKESFRLEALINSYLPKKTTQEETENLHNAITDVQLLKEVIDTIKKKENISDKQLKRKAKSFSNIEKKEKKKPFIEKYKNSFLKYKGKISNQLINKMANEGINVIKLEDAYKKGGINGLRLLLSPNINGKARVTNSEKLLKKIINALQSELQS